MSGARGKAFHGPQPTAMRDAAFRGDSGRMAKRGGPPPWSTTDRPAGRPARGSGPRVSPPAAGRRPRAFGAPGRSSGRALRASAHRAAQVARLREDDFVDRDVLAPVHHRVADAPGDLPAGREHERDVLLLGARHPATRASPARERSESGVYARSGRLPSLTPSGVHSASALPGPPKPGATLMFESLGEKFDGLWRKLQGQGRSPSATSRRRSATCGWRSSRPTSTSASSRSSSRPSRRTPSAKRCCGASRPSSTSSSSSIAS
mgnify:CR=1 FL=1